MSAKNNTDKRIFCASFSVRNGTKRIKFELAEATLFGGEAGLYRVRIDRRWHDIEGHAVFLDIMQITELAVKTSLGILTEPLPMPQIERKKRVKIILARDEDGQPLSVEHTWAHSPPVLGYDGKWKIAVLLYGKGVVFVNCDDIIQ